MVETKTKKTKPAAKEGEKPKRSLLGRAKKQKQEAAPQLVQPTQAMSANAFDTIKFVVMTEKAIQLIEKQNKLVFVVDRSATKSDIKRAVESAFSTNVSQVQTLVDQIGRKKAFVRFTKEGEAGEIAIKLGII